MNRVIFDRPGCDTVCAPGVVVGGVVDVVGVAVRPVDFAMAVSGPRIKGEEGT